MVKPGRLVMALWYYCYYRKSLIIIFIFYYRVAGAMGICFPYLGEFQATKYREKILCWMEMFWTLGVICLPRKNLNFYLNWRNIWTILSQPDNKSLSLFQLGRWFEQTSYCFYGPNYVVILKVDPFTQYRVKGLLYLDLKDSSGNPYDNIQNKAKATKVSSIIWFVSTLMISVAHYLQFDFTHRVTDRSSLVKAWFK